MEPEEASEKEEVMLYTDHGSETGLMYLFRPKGSLSELLVLEESLEDVSSCRYGQGC